MWAILLLITTVLAEDACKQRCDRIHQRSLARIGFDGDKLRHLLESQRPLGTLRDVCWRVYDNLDCMKHCDRTSLEHENFAKFVRSKCRFALKEMESALTCVSRHHSFMEVRCMSFLKEAETLKSKADPSYTPSQRICRYLHLNTLCLENTVTMYCANAKKLFRRLNFRDYFPNFVLPSNDTLFDDLDLDACQMFDFVKQNTKLSEAQLDMELTTVINYLESKHEATSPMMVTTPSTISQERREFTSLLNELLEDSTTSLELTTTSMPSINSTTMTRKTSNSTAATASKPPSTTYATTTTEAPITLSTAASKTSTASRHTTPTTTTAAAEPSASTDLAYSDEDEYDETGPDNVPVDDLRKGKEDHEEKENSEQSTTTKSRVFSEDSWEFTPPNFRYSSMRFENGGVTPLNIDTSTLFGMDEDDSEEDVVKDAKTEGPLKKGSENLEETPKKVSTKVEKSGLGIRPTKGVEKTEKKQNISVNARKGTISKAKVGLSREKYDSSITKSEISTTQKPPTTKARPTAITRKEFVPVGDGEIIQEAEDVGEKKLPSLALPTDPNRELPPSSTTKWVLPHSSTTNWPLPSSSTIPSSSEWTSTDPDVLLEEVSRPSKEAVQRFSPNGNIQSQDATALPDVLSVETQKPVDDVHSREVSTARDVSLEEVLRHSKEPTQTTAGDDIQPHKITTDPDVSLEEIRHHWNEETQTTKSDDNTPSRNRVLPADTETHIGSSVDSKHDDQDEPWHSSNSRRSQTTIKPRRPKIGIEKLRSPSAQQPTPSSPFLQGGVVIKKIHSWNDVNPSVEYGPYDDEDINDDNADNALDMDSVLPVEDSANHPSRNTSIVLDSAKEAADRETLVLIYSLLLAISVFTLMCILICFVWCRKTGHATITKPMY